MVSMIVAGSTGAIGRAVVQHAIRQPSIHSVVALTRSTNVAVANYEALFGVITMDGAGSHALAAGTVAVTSEEAAKIHPVTFDWEAFTQFWVSKHDSGASGSGEQDGASAAAATESPATMYQKIFSGHTYAASCLGTTRHDAGSAKKFMRCDYDYATAFVEAVMTYSAPAGLPPTNTWVHHIGDEGAIKPAPTHGDTAHEEDMRSISVDGNTPAQTTGTLRALCQVSASGADSSSWFLYLKTKGTADEATAERVHQHNRVAAAAATMDPVKLFLIHPGLLERHGKARTNEKLAKLIMSSIPVETCGAAIVSACVNTSVLRGCREDGEAAAEMQGDEEKAAKLKGSTGGGGVGAAADTPNLTLGKPFVTTKMMRKAGVSPNEPYPYMYVANNIVIKNLASRLMA